MNNEKNVYMNISDITFKLQYFYREKIIIVTVLVKSTYLKKKVHLYNQ